MLQPLWTVHLHLLIPVFLFNLSSSKDSAKLPSFPHSLSDSRTLCSDFFFFNPNTVSSLKESSRQIRLLLKILTYPRKPISMCYIQKVLSGNWWVNKQMKNNWIWLCEWEGEMWHNLFGFIFHETVCITMCNLESRNLSSVFRLIRGFLFNRH